MGLNDFQKRKFLHFLEAESYNHAENSFGLSFFFFLIHFTDVCVIANNTVRSLKVNLTVF